MIETLLGRKAPMPQLWATGFVYKTFIVSFYTVNNKIFLNR